MNQKKKKATAAAMMSALGVTSLMGPYAVLAQEDSTIINQQSQVEKQQEGNDAEQQELKKEGIRVSENTKSDEVAKVSLSSNAVLNNATPSSITPADDAFTDTTIATNAIKEAIQDYGISNDTTKEELEDYLITLFVDTGKIKELNIENMTIDTAATTSSVGNCELLINIDLYNDNYSNYSYSNSLPRLPLEGEVAINYKNFPDKAFRDYLKANYDTIVKDDVLSVEELKAITRVDVSDKGDIKSLKGIEYFTNLTHLYCNGTGITELDVRNNKKIQRLYCFNTGITELDVRNNEKLTRLNCNNTGIEELDLCNNQVLERLFCQSTKIKKLELKNHKNLIYIDCYDNQYLEILDVSGAIEVLTINCKNTNIKELDLKNCTELYWLTCNDTQLKTLSISNNEYLQYIYCLNTNITSLDVSNQPNLYELMTYDTNTGGNIPLAWVHLGNQSKLTWTKADSTIDLETETSYIDLKKEFPGIDIKRMSQIKNAHFDKEMLVIETPGKPVSYVYDCGKLNGTDVTLNVTINATEVGVSVDGKNFPDPNFLSYVKKFDTNNTGILTSDEISKATFIDVRNSGITSLKGIEHFTALNTLWCGSNAIKELDITKNTALTSLDVTATNLSALDVSRNLSLTRIICSGTNIESLNVSNNKDLTYLSCNSNNKLKELIVDGASSLENLNCSYTSISDLNVRDNNKLKTLNCEKTNISSLDVSQNSNLTNLNCSNTKLAWLNVGKNNSISSVTPPAPTLNMNITSDTFDITTLLKGIDVTKISNLQGATRNGTVISGFTLGTPITYEYNCGEVNGKEVMMKVTMNHTLLPITNAYFPDNKFIERVKSFDVDKDGNLNDIELSKITKLYANKSNHYEAIQSVKGIEYFPFLTELYCDGTQIENLDVSKNPALTKIKCGDTKISTLYLGNNKALEELSINDTLIETIDLSKNENLKMLMATDSLLSSLNVGNNRKLEDLYCRNTFIETLDLSNNASLTYLDCAKTNLKELNITNSPNLNTLYCEGSKSLESLTFSGKTALNDLDCSNTNIKELDVTGLPKLQKLWTWATDITTLNLRNNPNLTLLDTPQTNLAYLDWGDTKLVEAYWPSSSTFDLNVNKNTFDITKIFKGINASNVKILSNGSIDQNGIVSGYDMSSPIVYEYACGTADGKPVTMNVTLNISLIDSSIEITGNLDVDYTGNEIVDPAVITTGSNGDVTYIYQVKRNGVWEPLNGKPVNAGTYKVKAHLAGNDTHHDAESSEREFVIRQANNAWDDELSITDWMYDNYDELKHSPSASAKFGKPEYTYSDSEKGIFEKDVPKTAGTWYVRALVPETDNYKGIEKTISFTINKASAPKINIPNDLKGVQDNLLSSISLSGWTWVNDQEKVSVGKKDYTAKLVVDDQNYDYSGVEGYDAANHCVVRELPVQVANTDNSWAIEPSIENWTYGETASDAKGQALQGDTIITYSDKKDGTFTTDVPKTAGIWYMKASAPAMEGYNEIEEIVSFEIKKAKAPEIIVPDNLSIVHDKALENIQLPKGWYWVNGKQDAAMGTKEYLARCQVDDVNYDYSNVSGYDADGHYIEISIPVMVAKASNNWIKVPSLEGWRYGETSKQPSGEAVYGDIIFTYNRYEDGIFTKEQPTQAGTWYMKASIAGTEAYTGFDVIVSFVIEAVNVEDNKQITISDINSASDVEKLVIKDGDKVLVKGSDYDVEKKADGNKVTVTISFQGNYTGTIVKTYTEKPKEVETGDHSHTGLFASLAMLSAGCIAVLTGKKRKNKQ